MHDDGVLLEPVGDLRVDDVTVFDGDILFF
jgi:hypothetical protein